MNNLNNYVAFKLKKLRSCWGLVALLFAFFAYSAQAQPGETCDNPMVVQQLPFSDSGNIMDYGNNYNTSDVPATKAADGVFEGTGSTSYIGGYEAVYSITPTSGGVLTISTELDLNGWNSLFVFSGCPFEITAGYHTSTTGSSRQISNLPVEAGETYYIVISDWDVESVNYTITIDGTATIAPLEPCADATAGTIIDDFSVCAANAFTLETEGASFAEEGLSYQWWVSDDNQSWEPIDGATARTFKVSGGIDSEQYYYLSVSCD